ncbi:glutaredoxin family protein [Ferrimonas lipolytica]|uniref:Glutaredoxin family protein n=1 Tax=Ferrimonas lipolytica TaxID=2724191 RepID=A0A6H1UA40_9GAMM|nr:glutaredoxin family protein [Ferrimonas lipolytica]QIZ75911.1 glutaredoxin family protein [Ferrimonas lipolytica]
MRFFTLILTTLLLLTAPAHASFKKAIDANIKYDTDVVVYSSKDCPYCERAKEYFTEKEIDFRMVSIDDDKVAAAEMQLFGGTSVPVLVVEGKVLQGFVQTHVRQLLESTGKLEPQQ